MDSVGPKVKAEGLADRIDERFFAGTIQMDKDGQTQSNDSRGKSLVPKLLDRSNDCADKAGIDELLPSLVTLRAHVREKAKAGFQNIIVVAVMKVIHELEEESANIQIVIVQDLVDSIGIVVSHRSESLQTVHRHHSSPIAVDGYFDVWV